jgi:transcriptional regulator with PAS, ATPase and Fis domain
VDLYEHFCATFFEWTDTAVPLFASDHDEILGALDLALYRRAITPELRALVRSVGREIQSQIREQDALLRLVLLKRFAELADKYRTNGLVAFDQYGYVAALNSAAERQLSLPSSRAVGLRADKVSGLIDLLGPQTSDLLEASSSQKALNHSELFPATADRHAGNILLLSRSMPKRVESAWTTKYTFSDLIGKNRRFVKCLDLAVKASQQSCPLFIFGESGTGKELFAQAIHHASSRRDQNFVAFSCAGISDELIAAELFGYVEGSFTGSAKGGSVGKVQLAHQGTLFLDDIDSMAPRMQASLLRVIEDQRVIPIGSNKPRSVNVRVIAASNTDLDRASREGKFRRDLYFRLNVLSIELPPLRERRDDVPLLVNYLTDKVAPGATVTAEAVCILQDYDWPGNVRELRNVLIQAAVHGTGNEITPAALPQLSRQSRYSIVDREPWAKPASKSLKMTEREAILEALRTSNSTLEAATKLGIHFTTLYRKLRKYSLKSVESGRS